VSNSGTNVSRWKRRPEGSNWGDFGPDDQIGKMNLLTPEARLRAVREVEHGIAFCLSLPLDYPGGNTQSQRASSARAVHEQAHWTDRLGNIESPIHFGFVGDIGSGEASRLSKTPRCFRSVRSRKVHHDYLGPAFYQPQRGSHRRRDPATNNSQSKTRHSRVKE
jgi:hypothetical protein